MLVAAEQQPLPCCCPARRNAAPANGLIIGVAIAHNQMAIPTRSQLQAATLLLLNSASRASIMSNGLFAGFTPAVWLVTALTAAGGLLIAAVVKFADNVLKARAVLTSALGSVQLWTAGLPFVDSVLLLTIATYY